MKNMIVIAIVLILGACTDADLKQITSLGLPGEITCYSGGKVIYHAKSTGKIASEEKSDGWYFEDAATNKLVRISGQCVVIN